jgi:hypothetical protein
MEEEFDWGTAVHEAGHAVVGLKLGWDVDWVSAAPPITHFNGSGQKTVSEAMSMAAGGTLAELISAGEPVDDAFDEAIRVFHDLLGNEDVMSQTAKGLVASSPAEDLHNLAIAIDQHATRDQGIEQFREARAAAVSLLVENWDLVERLAHALQRDPSGESVEVVDLLADARSASD